LIRKNLANDKTAKKEYLIFNIILLIKERKADRCHQINMQARVTVHAKS
jgi:hypothetical protein